MSFPIVLDPSEVAANREELDLHSGPILVDHDGIDWGQAVRQQYMADQDVGSVPVDSRRANRTATIPLGLGMDDSGGFDAAKAALQQKVALISDEGGWVKRGDSGLFADVVDSRLQIPDRLGESGGVESDVQLELDYLPEWYSTEDLTRNVWTETQKPCLIFTETNLPGNYPSRVRWVITDLSGNDQMGLLYGIRCRHYDPAPTAALFIEAEAMTPVFDIPAAGAVGTQAGASGGGSNNGIAVTGLSSTFKTVLSTDLSSGGPLTHTGSYRAWLRVWTVDVSQFQFIWSIGDLTNPTSNSIVTHPGGSFYLLDMGEIRLDPAPLGTHRWTANIKAACSSGSNAFIDCMFLQPLDEYAGRLVIPGSTPLAHKPVVFGSRAAELRTDGCFRQTSDGVGSTQIIPASGNLPRVPPSGLEGRTVEFFLKLTRSDFNANPTLVDGGIDAVSSQIVPRACYLFPG